ncbi:unnamed protein product [Dibothriocephalus latus]|uniref:Retrotransposon gag domain-containing protein n=1 Tax=Dibothriocephalus latus TaxID=60516 RepID=A0A3P7QL61_DIBLA|nr:unnamed protein product [Dibothriocephalus latus]
MEKVTPPASRTTRPNSFAPSDDYDLWESRMKTSIETIDEGSRSTAVLECVDDQVLIVAMACKITSSLTTVTIFERLRREYGVPSTPWNTRKTLTGRKQLTGGSVGEYQRRLRVLARKAYPDSSFANLETKILDIFIEGVASDEVRREFAHSTPTTIKLALEYAQQEEAAFIAVPLREAVPSMTRDVFGPRPPPTVGVYATKQCQTREIGTQTAQWQMDPPPPPTYPSYGFPQPWQGPSQPWHGPPQNAAAWTGPLQPTSP